MDEIDGLLTVNQQPLGLKAILPQLESNSPKCTVVDFSKYDGVRYHTDKSVMVLCQFLPFLCVISQLALSNICLNLKKKFYFHLLMIFFFFQMLFVKTNRFESSCFGGGCSIYALVHSFRGVRRFQAKFHLLTTCRELQGIYFLYTFKTSPLLSKILKLMMLAGISFVI